MTQSSHSGHLRLARNAAWAGVAALALIIGGVSLWRAVAPQDLSEASFTGEADIRSDFTLTDHTGQLVTEADFADRWQLVFFGFTHCPDICPTTLAYMASVLDLLGDRADRVAPLFITVDPARDTVPIMAEYVSIFHPRLVGLTGTEAQVAEAAQNFRVYYERMDEEETAPAAPDDYLMAHSGYIYLMTPEGEFVDVFLEGEQPPEGMASEVLTHLEAEETS